MDGLITKTMHEHYLKAYIQMIFLLMLVKEDMYGFQLTRAIKNKSGGLLDIKEGSLYAPLYRLIDNGYISEKKVRMGGKRRVVSYYHIEEEGYKYLDYLLESDAALKKAIDNIKEYSEYVPGSHTST